MQLRKVLLLVTFLSLWFVTASCAQVNPRLTLSANRVLHHAHVFVYGTGFTPKQNISSHLRRPDGTEYPVLPILTDGQGKFTHDIDTLILGDGLFEVWVVDDASKMTSNHVQFEVTLN
jgi:hypothetical protein